MVPRRGQRHHYGGGGVLSLVMGHLMAWTCQPMDLSPRPLVTIHGHIPPCHDLLSVTPLHVLIHVLVQCLYPNVG